MAYSELIKDFEKIRSYMRDFYVYGFKGREEFNTRSSRVYDNEYRRVKSWLEGYIDSYYNESGKKVFISIDSRAIFHNPLYIAFKTKSFTDWDITLHFFLLDILADGPATVRDCLTRITDEYLKNFSTEFPDEGTVRNKLKEYEKMGILVSQKNGRNVLYSIADGLESLHTWRDAIQFFSETMPLGVIGTYFPRSVESAFEFKHQYLFSALDSEILYDLAECMHEKRGVELTIFSRRKKQELRHAVFPIRFYLSAQTGRQYVLGYHYKYNKLMFFRLDGVRRLKALDIESQPEKYEALWEEFDRHLWGISTGTYSLDHLEMLIHMEPDEYFIVERLQREKRHGIVEQVDESTWKFTADVYDAGEMIPWVRTFIGRIDHLECSNKSFLERFRDDLAAMQRMYGGESNAV